MDLFHRAIITAHSCLLFEPNTPQSKKFLECVTPRLTANEGARVLAEYRRNHDDYPEGENEQPPFELEMVEGALMVATGIWEFATCSALLNDLQSVHFCVVSLIHN